MNYDNTFGKSGTARILGEILISLNNPKITRKVASWLNGQNRMVKQILEIPKLSTRMTMLSVFNNYFSRVTRKTPDVIVSNLGVYTDPFGRQSDMAKEIRDRMFALVSERIRDGMHATKALIKLGIEIDDGWEAMETAPRDGTPILLFTASYGIVEAWFHPGEWDNNWEIREYSGPDWICADDKFQITVEEYRDENGVLQYHDGEALAWRPLLAVPMFLEEDDDSIF
jgi:hypothetical protein